MKIQAVFAGAIVLLFANGVSSTRATVIVNGDFELGDTGFTSAYTYVTPGGSSLFPEGVYTVDDNPHDSHSLFYSMSDHTAGGTEMMIVNGAGATGITVWSGTIGLDLTIGVEYDFSAWVASVHPASPAILTFSVDGVDLGTLSPTSDGTWSRLFKPFTATHARPVFKLINSNGASFGNDFAIDDIDVFFKDTTENPVSDVPDGGATLPCLVLALGCLGLWRGAPSKTTVRASRK